MTRWQTLRKFWHLELFWRDLLCNLILSHFLGRTSKKNTLYLFMQSIFWLWNPLKPLKSQEASGNQLPRDQRRHLSWSESARSWNFESNPTNGSDRCGPECKLSHVIILWEAIISIQFNHLGISIAAKLVNFFVFNLSHNTQKCHWLVYLKGVVHKLLNRG